jgi:regulatory protein
MTIFNKNIGIEEARKKIRHYCAYQERCHQEVEAKLYSYGLNETERMTLIGELLEENFLNEERFAHSYVRGKFRMKQWGKEKIKSGLMMKGVSSYCIKTALKTIEWEEYGGTIRKLYHQKNSGKKKVSQMQHQKTVQYLMQKGYAYADIHRVLQETSEE